LRTIAVIRVRVKKIREDKGWKWNESGIVAVWWRWYKGRWDS